MIEQPSPPPSVLRSLADLAMRGSWAPLLVFGAHVVIARVFDGYIYYPRLDVPMHLLGGVAIAYFLTRCFAAVPAGALAPPHRAALGVLLVMGLTATAAVLWELAEYVLAGLSGTRARADIEDTLLDMGLGIAGAVCWCGFALWTGRLASLAVMPARSDGARGRR